MVKNLGQAAFGRVILTTGQAVYGGAQTTRATVRAEVGDTAKVGSIYMSTAGKVYAKVAATPNDSDWQRVTTSAAD